MARGCGKYRRMLRVKSQIRWLAIAGQLTFNIGERAEQLGKRVEGRPGVQRYPARLRVELVVSGELQGKEPLPKSVDNGIVLHHTTMDYSHKNRRVVAGLFLQNALRYVYKFLELFSRARHRINRKSGLAWIVDQTRKSLLFGVSLPL
jgi:hypothetical protein